MKALSTDGIEWMKCHQSSEEVNAYLHDLKREGVLIMDTKCTYKLTEVEKSCAQNISLLLLNFNSINCC